VWDSNTVLGARGTSPPEMDQTVCTDAQSLRGRRPFTCYLKEEKVEEKKKRGTAMRRDLAILYGDTSLYSGGDLLWLRARVRSLPRRSKPRTRSDGRGDGDQDAMVLKTTRPGDVVVPRPPPRGTASLSKQVASLGTEYPQGKRTKKKKKKSPHRELLTCWSSDPGRFPGPGPDDGGAASDAHGGEESRRAAHVVG
jgi:hypothetical protein